MSGLVSKWATDATLSEEAKKQDGAHPEVDKKRGIESKWADAPDLASSKVAGPATEKKVRNNHKHQDSRSRDNDSPAKRGNARHPHSHPKHRHPETPPRSAESEGGNIGGTSKKWSRNRRTSRGSVGDEELAPMSEAAKAFAARLGMPSPPSSRDGDLASRLGVENHSGKHDKPKGHKEKPKENSHPDKPKPRSKPDKPRVDREGKPHSRPGEKYLAPKERRQREQHARQSQAASEQEEKAAEELRQLLDKLDSKELDWASFD